MKTTARPSVIVRGARRAPVLIGEVPSVSSIRVPRSQKSPWSIFYGLFARGAGVTLRSGGCGLL